MCTHNMFLWRTDENYPLIIIKYPPYLIFGIFTGDTYSNTVIVFMTDGADTVNPKEMLPQMPTKLRERWGEINKDVVIHTVGFTSGNFNITKSINIIEYFH